ncbi:hypothetical protein [Kitasatospora sp. NPDC090308]|uniref:hypothetical protein n=1 Tax=Kitasatospora sp. NPDC090308 TaxID=3364082 RepID=UPI00381B157C
MADNAPPREVGFYASAADVSSASRPTKHSWEPMAVGYLKQGAVIMASPGWVDDLLDDQAKNICQYATLTDGSWIWPSNLAYYVETYHVALPADFLNHMESHGWDAPEVSDEELDAIDTELEKRYGFNSKEH